MNNDLSLPFPTAYASRTCRLVLELLGLTRPVSQEREHLVVVEMKSVSHSVNQSAAVP